VLAVARNHIGYLLVIGHILLSQNYSFSHCLLAQYRFNLSEFGSREPSPDRQFAPGTQSFHLVGSALYPSPIKSPGSSLKGWE